MEPCSEGHNLLIFNPKLTNNIWLESPRDVEQLCKRKTDFHRRLIHCFWPQSWQKKNSEQLQIEIRVSIFSQSVQRKLMKFRVRVLYQHRNKTL